MKLQQPTPVFPASSVVTTIDRYNNQQYLYQTATAAFSWSAQQHLSAGPFLLAELGRSYTFLSSKLAPTATVSRRFAVAAKSPKSKKKGSSKKKQQSPVQKQPSSSKGKKHPGAPGTISSSSKIATRKPNKAGGSPPGGVKGRVVLQQHSAGKRISNAVPKLCSGCGTQVVSAQVSGRRSNNTDSANITGTRLVGGEDTMEHTSSLSKRIQKKTRYMDVGDYATRPMDSFLCSRCQSLQRNDIWGAYDALRDIEPKVFSEQLRFIVARRKFGMCIMVVDATDPEHTVVKHLRRTIGSIPVILVINKIDLLPRCSESDVMNITRRIEAMSGVRFTSVFDVSATNGVGLVRLAESILLQLGGRDVFVIGAANVGKSSLVKTLSPLIAESVYLKGQNRFAVKRRATIKNLKVTGSNLPGTTLQAVRVPCFPSDSHALWDTPGVISPRALQYKIFPAHLMEPLTRPEAIPIPAARNGLKVSLREGQSLLIEASWMGKDEENTKGIWDEDEETCVLGRIDVVQAKHHINAQAFLHPSLRLRVVPTSRAPDRATIPSFHIARVKKRIFEATRNEVRGLADEYSLPLLPFLTETAPDGRFVAGYKEFVSASGRYVMDVSFASLGWVGFIDNNQYGVIPYCVEGSIFSKRRSLYPFNLAESVHSQEYTEQIPDHLDERAVKRQLSIAANEGRHTSNKVRQRF
jgi:GTP-binding protein EngB required for normal cell division